MRTRLSHTMSASAPYSTCGCARVSVVMCPPLTGLSPAKHFAELVATVREHLCCDGEEQQHEDATAHDGEERPIGRQLRVIEPAGQQLEAKRVSKEPHDRDAADRAAKHRRERQRAEF